MSLALVQDASPSPLMLAVMVLAAGLLIYLAYKIGKFVLRVLAGLLVLAAVVAVWYFFFRGP